MTLADERRALLDACMGWMGARFDLDAALLLHRRTAQGRVATELSYKKLGLKPNRGGQPSLW